MIEPIIALIALSLMEIVLGIDNIVFISILTSKLPKDQQSAGRKLGLLFALVTRVALLSCIFWIAHEATAPILRLTNLLPIEPLQSYFMEEVPAYRSSAHEADLGRENALPSNSNVASQGSSAANGSMAVSDANAESNAPQKVLDEHAWEEFVEVSIRDLILIAGGLFLLYNSVREIHVAVEGDHEHAPAEGSQSASFAAVIVQIGIMDIVFSLDSVITAVGMAEQLWVMIAAVVLAVGVMILFANQVGDFVDQNPTIRMLALSFLLLIGIMLVAEGIGTPISKGYIYFAMAFSLLVEAFNMRIRKQSADATLLGSVDR